MLPIRALPAARNLARTFSTSVIARDVSKLTLVGRLGNDPQAKQSSNGKEFYMYTVATQNKIKEGDSWVDGPTSWHNVFSFNEFQHPQLKALTKGSTVYVEADLEMRPTEAGADGQRGPDRVLLRQLNLKTIARKRPEGQTEE